MAQDYFFPDEAASESVKSSPQWLTPYAKAAMFSYAQLPINSVGYKSAGRYEENRAYANGRQPIDKYKALTSPDQDPNNNRLAADFSIIHTIPKYRNIALGLMEKNSQTYNISIDPIDSLAQSETEKQLADMKAKLSVKEQLMAQGLQQYIQNQPLRKDSPSEPDDLDGVKMMELGVRHRTAMEVEQLSQLIFNANNYNSLSHIKDQDLFDCGFTVLKQWRDGNEIKIRRCRPEGMIMSYCYDPFFSDWRYMGEIMKVTTPQLIEMSSGQITQQQLKYLYDNDTLLTCNNLAPFNNGGYGWETVWNTWHWSVLDLVIKTTDTIEREESVDKRGNLQYGKLSEDKKKQEARFASGKYKYVKKQIEQIYRVKWICGTDIIFDYGKMPYVQRDKRDKTKVINPYVCYASRLSNMRAYARAEACIPHADNIQTTYAKLQHALNRAIPRGYDIDISSLESVALKHHGAQFGVSDLIDMLFRDGVILHRSQGLPGHDEKFGSPITPIEGGVGSEIQEFWTMIQQSIEGIRAVLGLNDITDASTPNAKTLNGVAQMAQIGTNNAMSDLFYADRYIKQELTKGVVITAQGIIKDDTANKIFVDSLGAGTVRILKSIGDIHKYLYSVSVEDKPTDMEMAAFAQDVNMALQQGQIFLPDKMMIDNISNMKQKQEYLAYKVEKNLQKAQENSMMNAEQQKQAAIAIEQSKQQTLQMEYQLKGGLSKQEFEQLLQIEQMKIQGLLEGKRIDATGRVEASVVQAEGRDQSNIRDNKTALIKEDKTDNVGDISIPANLRSNVQPATSDEHPNLDFSFLKNAS